MSDLVQRLRALSDAQLSHNDVRCLTAEAADEIAWCLLRWAANARRRAAAEPAQRELFA